MHLEQLACGSRVCRLLRVTEVCPAPPSSQLRPEAGPCRCPASTARRAGVQSHDALFRSESRVSTSGVSKVGEGPRSAGTRRPPVQDRITHPGRFTRPRANHSQYVEQRVVPHVISLPCRTRASIVTCWRPCALLARSIRARALTQRHRAFKSRISARPRTSTPVSLDPPPRPRGPSKESETRLHECEAWSGEVICVFESAPMRATDENLEMGRPRLAAAFS